ncbi:MAG TPA: hypothetical protein VK066_04535 [Chloroflexota bacterium]|nr:hypothetical protein [Chloroflexota bacterium]
MPPLLDAWLGAVFSYPDLPTALSSVAKTAIVYAFVIVGLRLLGARELGQMTTYDFVLVVVMANIACSSCSSPGCRPCAAC